MVTSYFADMTELVTKCVTLPRNSLVNIPPIYSTLSFRFFWTNNQLDNKYGRLKVQQAHTLAVADNPLGHTTIPRMAVVNIGFGPCGIGSPLIKQIKRHRGPRILLIKNNHFY